VKLYHSVRRLALSSTFHRLKTATLLRVLKMLLPADGGAALVEGALILPVFLLLVGGVYEFGFFLYQEQLVTSGIEDAARYLALSADPTGTNIQADARNLAVTGSINGGPSRVNGWSTSDVYVTVDSVDNTSGTYSGGSTIQIVTVSTKYLDPTLGFLTLLHLKPPTISVSHQERVVGGSAPGQG
jgi:adhesin HecA-like repeat protein